MSPKDPEPILRPSRYFLPTRSSIGPGCASAARPSGVFGPSVRRRAPGAYLEAVRGVAGPRAAPLAGGEVGRALAFGAQPGSLGHRAKLWLFSASTVCYSTQPNVLQIASKIARARPPLLRNPGGGPRPTRNASQRERGIPRRRGRPRYMGLVSPAFEPAKSVAFICGAQSIIALYASGREPATRGRSSTKPSNPVENAAGRIGPFAGLRRVCSLSKAAERRTAEHQYSKIRCAAAALRPRCSQ